MSIPRVIIVIASSLDGRIAFPGGGESHLGSEEDKKMLKKPVSLESIKKNEDYQQKFSINSQYG